MRYISDNGLSLLWHNMNLAGRLNQVDLPANNDVSGFDRPPDNTSTLASMKVKVNKLLPSPNLKGKLITKKEK